MHIESFDHHEITIFYRYLHGHCSLEIKNIISHPVRCVRTTSSSTQSHRFQVTLPNPRTLAHKSFSFQEILNYGTHCLPLLSMKPTTYHPSNLTSANLILSLYPPNLSPFSKFFLSRGIVIGPKPFPCRYILKKVIFNRGSANTLQGFHQNKNSIIIILIIIYLLKLALHSSI